MWSQKICKFMKWLGFTFVKQCFDLFGFFYQNDPELYIKIRQGSCVIIWMF